ncbi:hypothetical protein JST97_27790 [bacterium]|nr:hypothetical protein [bacterium]
MKNSVLTLVGLFILAGCSGGGSANSTGGGTNNILSTGSNSQVSTRLLPPAPPGQPGTFRFQSAPFAAKDSPEAIRPLTQPLSLSLQTGWNLVSVPYVTPSLLNISQPGNVLACSRYDAAAGQYIDVPFNQAGFSNHNPFTGYWVYCSGPTQVTIDGPDTSGDTLTTNLSVGWNLVGTPEPLAVSSANLKYGSNTLLNAFQNFRIWPGVLSYNPATTAYFELGNPPTTLPPGQAQWIYAYQADTLSRPGTALIYNAASDFASSSNPRGSWSYGDLSNFSSPNFTPYTVSVANVTQTLDGNPVTSPGLEAWAQSNPAPGNTGSEIIKNTTSGTLTFQTIQLPNDRLGLLPLSSTPDLRWTAPTAGNYTVDGSFSQIDVDPQIVNVRILKNLNISLHSIDNLRNNTNQGDFHFTVNLAAGDVLDFAARCQNPGTHGATGLKATISRNDPNALTFNVSAFDNIFGAQFGDAPNPGEIGTGQLGGGRVAKFYDFNSAPSGAFFTFPSVVNNSPAPNQSTGPIGSPDGYLRTAGSELVSDYRGLSGTFYTTAPYQSFGLVGVFTNPATTTSSTPPARYDFSVAGESVQNNAPLLNQVFFIGDGLTGTGTGVLQEFAVPAGATRLTIGFSDSAFGSSPPSGYQDNSGSLTATMVLNSGMVGAKQLRP